MEPHELIHIETDIDYRADIMLTYLESNDSGNAGAMAVDQLLSSLPSQRVAVFDTDMLIDYRSHRPLASMSEWMIDSLHTPQIVIDLIHDDSGTPILVLHGPEPDAKWQRFSECVLQFAIEAGVELCVTMKGMPAAVPHTRGSMVHRRGSDPQLVAGQPPMGDASDVLVSASTYLQHWLSQEGIASVGFLATVPFYLPAMNWPRASLALLKDLGERLDLALPTGSLEAAVHSMDASIDEMFVVNEESGELIRSLEEKFDEHLRHLSGPQLASSLETNAAKTTGVGPDKPVTIDSEALASTIQAFLARVNDAEESVVEPGHDVATYDPREEPGRARPRHARRPSYDPGPDPQESSEAASGSDAPRPPARPAPRRRRSLLWHVLHPRLKDDD